MSAGLALVGWAGAALLVLAYGLVSVGRLAASSLPFQLLNMAGGIALAANSGTTAPGRRRR